jgi:AraC-like DNA-binding protein
MMAGVGRERLLGRIVFIPDGMASIAYAGAVRALWPQRALWIAADEPYALHGREPIEAIDLIVESSIDSTQMIAVSPLLRELILEGARLRDDCVDSLERASIMTLIRLRLVDTPALVDTELRLPPDRRLRRLCETILSDPSDHRTIDEWARHVGMSRRTLTRRFRDETGSSFSLWRQQARLQAAVARLEQGQPITTIAYDVGYESPGSFSTIFRQTFGTTPSRFLNRQHPANIARIAGNRAVGERQAI